MLYLQKMQDTLLISVDSLEIKGDDNFTLGDDIESPEFYFLSLDKDDGDSLTDKILFFGEAGEIKINTLLRTLGVALKSKGLKINSFGRSINLLCQVQSKELREL